MNNYFQNVAYHQAMNLVNLIEFVDGGINRLVIGDSEKIKINLIALDKGQMISTDCSDSEAMVMVLSGNGIVTLVDKGKRVTSGETIFLPKDKGHSLMANEPLKVLIVEIL